MDQPVDSIPEPDSVRLLDFQVGWFKKKGYFEKRVGDLVRKQEEDRLRVEAEAKAEYEAKVAEEEAKEREERERALKQQKELEREAQRKKLYENGQEVKSKNLIFFIQLIFPNFLGVYFQKYVIFYSPRRCANFFAGPISKQGT